MASNTSSHSPPSHESAPSGAWEDDDSHYDYADHDDSDHDYDHEHDDHEHDEAAHRRTRRLLGGNSSPRNLPRRAGAVRRRLSRSRWVGRLARTKDQQDTENTQSNAEQRRKHSTGPIN